MNRARRGQDLFIDKADYQQFIDLLFDSIHARKAAN
jgi:hypothetical protein